MKKNKMLLVAIALIVIAGSCKKSDVQTAVTPPVDTTVTVKDSAGFYILNQGNFGHNDTKLTFYNLVDSMASNDDYFFNINGFHLGDTGDDFIIYGGKMYIVMNGSGYVAVVNPSNGKFIDSISFINGSSNRGPENIVAYQNKVFVSSTDGTVAVIDTTTLTAGKFITVGTNPQQMVVSGTNLYVSNSGGQSAPPFDSTLSVVDLNTLTEITKIKVGNDPQYIAADNAGNVYVACAGDYTSATNLPSFVKVSTATNTVVKSSALTVSGVRFFNNSLYAIVDYSDIKLINPSDLTEAASSFITDGTAITSPYSLDIDPKTGDVFVGDAKNYVLNGEVFWFDKNGKEKLSIPVPAANPGKVVLK